MTVDKYRFGRTATIDLNEVRASIKEILQFDVDREFAIDVVEFDSAFAFSYRPGQQYSNQLLAVNLGKILNDGEPLYKLRFKRAERTGQPLGGDDPEEFMQLYLNFKNKQKEEAARLDAEHRQMQIEDLRKRFPNLEINEKEKDTVV